MSDAATLIVGVGSDHGDDRLGWLLADWLAGCVPAGVSVRKVRTPVQLLDRLAGVSRLCVIDACHGSGQPGEVQPGDVQRFLWPDVPAQAAAFAGTHDLGLLDALRLAEALGQLPPRVVVWGVMAAGTPQQPGGDLSPALAAAFPSICAQLQAELAAEFAAPEASYA